jgi:hypothetical protein
MYVIGREYIFRIKNQSSSKGYSIYTGVVTEVTANKIFLTSIKEENISFDICEILNGCERKQK